ncbi:hypothetical protein ACFQ1I_05090 [Kitasatospora arboriphila]
MNDAQLAALLTGCAEAPYPGTWQDAPSRSGRSRECGTPWSRSTPG